MLEPRKEVVTMTVGQRIQDLRKQHNLSQESLGEQLGVSRQAISKWESDNTLPEVEKLVALSRLFGVPVGQLLGVEPPEGNPGEPVPEELTERELKAVEAIVSRYLQAGERHRTPRRKWPFVLGSLAICVCLFNLFHRLDQMDSQYQSLQYNLNYIQDNMYSIQNGVADQVTEILEKQNTLIADWSYTVDQLQPGKAVELTMRVTPKEYTQGMSAQLWAGEVSLEGQWDGKCYSGQLTVPLEDEVPLSVVFYSGDTQKTQTLETLWGLESATRLDLQAGFWGSTSFPQNTREVEGAGIQYEGRIRAFLERDLASKFKLKLYPIKGEVRAIVKGKQVAAVALDMERWAKEDYATEDLQEWNQVFPLGKLQVGDEVKLIFAVTDNYGQSYEKVIDWWRAKEDNGRVQLDMVDIDSGNFIFA